MYCSDTMLTTYASPAVWVFVHLPERRGRTDRGLIPPTRDLATQINAKSFRPKNCRDDLASTRRSGCHDKALTSDTPCMVSIFSLLR